MQSSGLMGAAFRRWYVTIIGLFVTAALCYGAALLVPVKYEATARVLLLPPDSVVGKGGNPFLLLGGLDTATSILGRTLSEPDMVERVSTLGASGKFTVAPDDLTSGPVLLVTADSATRTAALQSLGVVLKQVPSTLANMQSSLGVPKNAWIASTVITQDRVAEAVRKSQVRALLVAAAGGLAGTLMLVALVDAYLLRRSRMRLRTPRSDELRQRPGESKVDEEGDRLPEHYRRSPESAGRISSRTSGETLGAVLEERLPTTTSVAHNGDTPSPAHERL